MLPLSYQALYVIFLKTSYKQKRFLSFANSEEKQSQGKEAVIFFFCEILYSVLTMFYSRHDAENLHFRKFMFTFLIFT